MLKKKIDSQSSGFEMKSKEAKTKLRNLSLENFWLSQIHINTILDSNPICSTGKSNNDNKNFFGLMIPFFTLVQRK